MVTLSSADGGVNDNPKKGTKTVGVKSSAKPRKSKLRVVRKESNARPLEPRATEETAPAIDDILAFLTKELPFEASGQAPFGCNLVPDDPETKPTPGETRFIRDRKGYFWPLFNRWGISLTKDRHRQLVEAWDAQHLAWLFNDLLEDDYPDAPNPLSDGAYHDLLAFRDEILGILNIIRGLDMESSLGDKVLRKLHGSGALDGITHAIRILPEVITCFDKQWGMAYGEDESAA